MPTFCHICNAKITKKEQKKHIRDHANDAKRERFEVIERGDRRDVEEIYASSKRLRLASEASSHRMESQVEQVEIIWKMSNVEDLHLLCFVGIVNRNLGCSSERAH